MTREVISGEADSSASLPGPEVLERIWPGEGPSDVDRALLETLSPGRRALAFARLAAMADIDDGKASVAGTARRMGVARSALVKLRSKWSDERSVAAVLPFVGRRARPASIGAESSSELRIARRLLESHGAETTADLVRRLMAETSSGMSRPTAVRIVRQVRSEGRKDAALLRPAYGTRLLIDTCAVSMLADEVSESVPYVAAFVVERASTLILSAEIDVRDRAVETQRRAVGTAATRIAEMALDRVGPDALLRIVLADGWPEPDDEGRRLTGLPVEEVIARPGRRNGEHLTYLLGKRIGSLWLHPRSTPTGSDPPTVRSERFGRPVSGFVAASELAAAVAAHNDVLLRAVRDAGVADAGNASGAMSRPLSSLAQAWT